MTEKKTTAAKAKPEPTLIDALAAFQAELPDVALDGTNPHFKSKYATLAGITKKVLPVLNKHGLVFTVGSFVDNGVLVLDAHLLHTSGESRSAQFPINETNPQKVGSAVSYYRRYALSALTGIVADEDDDGNAASAPAPQAVQTAQAAKGKPSPAPARKGVTPSQAKIKEKFVDTGEVELSDLNWMVDVVKKEIGEDEKNEKVYAEVLKRLEAGETK